MKVGAYVFAVLMAVVAVVLLPIAIPGYLLCRWTIRILAIRRFRKRFHPEGKYLLFVTSESPNWKDYIETKILPFIGGRAVTLNWSERQFWDSDTPGVQLFKAMTGISNLRPGGRRGHYGSDYNPLAVLVPPSGRIRKLAFYRAFKAMKKNRSEMIESLHRQLLDFVAALPPPSQPKKTDLGE